MKHQDQRNVETLESRMLECAQERRDENYAPRPYCPPQVWLVGKAKRLMAGDTEGDYNDWNGWYYYM